MIIESVTTKKEAAEENYRQDRMELLYKKYPGIQVDLYWAETGEHLQ